MTVLTAMNILKSRAFLNAGVTKNVQVTNVSFINPKTGQPFQDDNWDEGKPYAIANFNMVNAYGKAQSIEHLENEEYQEACNTNESMRVRPELGKALAEAMYASVVGKSRTWTVTDKDTGTDSEVTAIKLHKAIPNVALDASEVRAYDDVFDTKKKDKAEVDANLPPA